MTALLVTNTALYISKHSINIKINDEEKKLKASIIIRCSLNNRLMCYVMLQSGRPSTLGKVT